MLIEDENADTEMNLPKVVKRRAADTSLQNLLLFTSILDDYVTASRNLNGELFPKNEVADEEKNKNVAEGDILKDIQDVWVEATLGMASA